MTRLDAVIDRLNAQRSCLNDVVDKIKDMPGHVLELGLGNGRTYDHIRDLFPDRKIYVFEKDVAAHPDCIPPDDCLFLGRMPDTLIDAEKKLGANAVLIHADIGFGSATATARNVAAIGPCIAKLLAPGGYVFCDQCLDEFDGLEPVTMPPGVVPGRYFGYRKN